MSPQAQNFEIYEKSSLWVSVVRAVSGSSGVCTPHQLCLLLDLMLNAHANSNITCTQTMCPIKSVPELQAHGTQFSGTRVSFLSLFFFSLSLLYRNNVDVSTTICRRHGFLPTSRDLLVSNAMAVDRVDDRDG